MAINCPVCRANNETGPGCRRCKADLALLFQIESERYTLMRTATEAIAGTEAALALERAAAADRLRRDRESVRLLACASLLHGDYPEALRLYRIADVLPSAT